MTSEEPDQDTYALISHPNIGRLQFGPYSLQTWYGTSVYFARDHRTLGFKYAHSEEAHRKRKVALHEDTIWCEKLFVCDFCFKYTDNQDEFNLHYDEACTLKASTGLGKLVYRDDLHSIRKIRGSKHKLFCQNLCLLTKLYLDNKSVFFDVDHFEFFVIYDNVTYKPMGFFSKELLSLERNNLACILVFPPYQRQHLGTKLISFSYEISKVQYLISGPEKPLSPFGLVGYLRYWSVTICRLFLKGGFFEGIDLVSIDEIANVTGIRHDDINMTLRHMKVLLKDEDSGEIMVDRSVFNQWVNENKIPKEPLIKPGGLLL